MLYEVVRLCGRLSNMKRKYTKAKPPKESPIHSATSLTKTQLVII